MLLLQGACCNHADAVQVTLSTSASALCHQVLTNATQKKNKNQDLCLSPPTLQSIGAERERKASSLAWLWLCGRQRLQGWGTRFVLQLLGGVGNMGACGQQTAPCSLSKAASVSGKCHSPACFPAGRSISSSHRPLPLAASQPCGRMGPAGWGRAGERVAMGLRGEAGPSAGDAAPSPSPLVSQAPLLTRQFSSLAPLGTF